jgi:DNA-binding MarR family transcriptional regulator
MSTEKTAEKFMQLMQKYIWLKPKLILPEHVVQFKKKMEALKGSSYSSEDHSYVFRILILLAQSQSALTMSELSTELNVPTSSATRIVDWLVRGDMVERVNDLNDRRVVRVGMSKMGRQYYENGLSYNKQRLGSLLKDFTEEEQSQLLYLMDKLFNSLMNEVSK